MERNVFTVSTSHRFVEASSASSMIQLPWREAYPSLLSMLMVLSLNHPLDRMSEKLDLPKFCVP